jgi:putative protease
MMFNNITTKPELLAPAGNFVKMKTAFMYGADAVYMGGHFFSLRSQAGNFSNDEMREAVKLANSLGKKIYVTMNIISRDSDLEKIAEYAKELYEIGVHGVIVADIGTFMLVRETVPELPVHVSTQANNLNWKTIKFWLDNGAVRVNLARELSLEEIKVINENLIKNCESVKNGNNGEPYLEAFVHGAMCMSFSGRCMLSDYMAGRSSNRGDCAQPCRWNYFIAEERRPGEYIQVEDNERGTFIFNSKDLCMAEYLPELMETGVGSLKIEGRMKSEFYTAVTVRAYRIAIDECFKDPAGYAENKALKEEIMRELCSVSHRDYSTGFYLGDRGEQIYTTSSYLRDTDFIGVVEEASENEMSLRVKGAFNKGETLEVVVPGVREIITVKAEYIINEKGESVDRAANPMSLMKIPSDKRIVSGSVVRRRI